MQLTLLVPELIWPEVDDGVLDGARCPALETLLARSERTRRAAQSLEATLADVFGYVHDAPEAPYAALRLLGEAYAGDGAAVDARDISEASWLCCDPIHLHFHQQHMIVADSGSFPLTLDEAREVARLQHEITVLREARDVVTHSATPAVIYGRMDDLINRRQDALLGIFKSAAGAELAEVNTRG